MSEVGCLKDSDETSGMIRAYPGIPSLELQRKVKIHFGIIRDPTTLNDEEILS